jgi:hypothetical protein
MQGYGGGMTRVSAAPTTVGVTSSFAPQKRGSESITLPFKELVAVSIPTGTAANTVIANLTLGMATFAGTRLSLVANTWEKFKFLKLSARVITSAPSSTAGNMILAWDADPTDNTPPNTAGGMQMLTTMAAAEVFPIWQGLEMPIPIDSDRETGFFTNFNSSAASPADPRLYEQGQLYLATMAPPVSSQQMTLEVAGVCRFWTRALEQPSAPTETTNATPASLNSSSTYVNNNVLAPQVPGVAGQSILNNGINALAQAYALFGNSGYGNTTGALLTPGNYEILWSGKGLQTGTASSSISGFMSPMPGSRANPSLVVDAPFSQLLIPASVASNLNGRWFANVVDPVGALFYLILSTVSTGVPLTSAGAQTFQIRKVTSAN